MAQGLEHRKQGVLEGSSMAVGAVVAALWRLRKTTIWHQNMRFYLVLRIFTKSEWVQTLKELTLSVLKTLVEFLKSTGSQYAG